MIGEVGWDISALMLHRELVGRTEDLTINLFSYGGDAIEGLAIYSMLARYPGKKRMVIDGGCIVGLLRGLKIRADFPQGMFCEFERIGSLRLREAARATKYRPGILVLNGGRPGEARGFRERWNLVVRGHAAPRVKSEACSAGATGVTRRRSIARSAGRTSRAGAAARGR
jgi:hypothetical protein